MTNVLESELITYNQQRDSLLAHHNGKYVLIHKDQVISIFDTQQDAIRHGYHTLGNVAFLVKRVEEVEMTQNFVSNLFAI